MPEYTKSDRGFKSYEPLRTSYGHRLSVGESSAAMEPHLWLWVDSADAVTKDQEDVSIHLTFKQAKALRKMLKVAMRQHYQVDASEGRQP